MEVRGSPQAGRAVGWKGEGLRLPGDPGQRPHLRPAALTWTTGDAGARVPQADGGSGVAASVTLGLLWLGKRFREAPARHHCPREARTWWGRWFGKSVGSVLSPRLVIVPGTARDPQHWAAPEPCVPEKWPLPAGVSPGWGQGPEAGSDLVQRVLPCVSSCCSANRDGAARVQGHQEQPWTRGSLSWVGGRAHGWVVVLGRPAWPSRLPAPRVGARGGLPRALQCGRPT